MEFSISGDDVRMFEVAEDGSLVAVDPMSEQAQFEAGTA